jgi:hypothetical protein
VEKTVPGVARMAKASKLFLTQIVSFQRATNDPILKTESDEIL